MWHEWSPMKKLIWLRRFASGVSYILKTVTGAIVHITDAIAGAVESLSVSVEPVQNLNGYDHPWPAGGGKNKLDTSTVTVGGVTFTQDADGYITANPNTGDGRAWGYASCQYKTTLPAGNYKVVWIIKTASTSANRGIGAYKEDGTELFRTLATQIDTDGSASFELTETTTIGVMSKLYDGSWRLMVIADSDGNTWTPYSNECPISGFSAVNLWRTGKNLFDPNANPGKYLNATGGLSSHEGAATSDYIRIPTVAGQVVNLSTPISGTKHICVYTEDKSFIRRVYNGGDGEQLSTTSLTLTQEDVAAGAAFIRASTYSEADRMLTFGEPAAYEPYSGNTYTIQLGQTVYGGTLDVTAGTMTVDRAMVDLGTLSYLYRNGLFDATVSGGKLKGYATGEARAISSNYAQKAKPYTQLIAGEMAFGTGYVNGSTCSVIIKNTAYTDAATFKTALSGVQLVYELATPIEIPLTPTQIATLQGENNVWSDAGDVTVTYRASAS